MAFGQRLAHKCEGLIGIADLSQVDNFVFMEGEYCLVGRGTGIRFQIGDKVKVKVVATNLEKRQIDYTLAELPAASRSRVSHKSIDYVDGGKGKPHREGKSKKSRK